MYSESVCQVARSWVDVSSFHTRLFGVVYLSCGDFHDGSEKGRASVHQMLCQSWEKCYRDLHNDSTSLRGPKPKSCAGVSMECPVQDRSTSVDDEEHTGRPRSCTIPENVYEFKSSSVRIDVGPFTILLRWWELVMGHANGFWRKKWECTMSQSNLCPGSWQLTKSSNASTYALNFISSPPMMKLSCPGSPLVTRSGFTVTTLRQSNNLPSGKPQRHRGQKRPDRWKVMSTALSSLSLTPRGLCTRNLCQQVKMWISGSTATFCGYYVKTCEEVAPNFGENRPDCFTMTSPRLTLLSSSTSFWRKTRWLSSPTQQTPLIWHPSPPQDTTVHMLWPWHDLITVKYSPDR